MAPSPSYLPASCRDGEGAPLLRPLARLTSFGGYVATTNCQLPTINYSLSTTFLHFYTAISTARAPSPLLRPLARLTSFGGYVATTNCQLPTTNYSLSTTFLHFYTAIFTTARAPSLLHGHFPRRRGAVATGGTRSRASAFSSMRSLVRRPCGPVPGHQASSRCLRRAIEAASARFVAPSLAKMALTCSLTV